MLIRNSIYQAVGGHGAVHNVISEDRVDGPDRPRPFHLVLPKFDR